MQIVQELCKRPGLNRTGFDMPTIYIPNPNKQVRCVNQIDDVCRDIEKTINQTIQVSVFIFFLLYNEVELQIYIFIMIHKGPFKYYVINGVGGWGQKMAIFDDLQ